MDNRYEVFTGLIAKINRMIKKIKAEEMAEYELKVPHASCLYYLYSEGNLSATQLCERCGEDKGAMSRALDYLEANGYIAFESNGSKKYKNPVKLTEKGVLTGERIANKIEKVMQVAGEGLGDERRKEMYSGLAVICANLQRLCEEY